MKLKDLLEGTWEAPQTVAQAQMLAQLMDKPIPAQKAPDMLYDLIGDDQLYDQIAEVEEEDPDGDVRSLVAGRIRDWIKEGKNTGFSSWSKTWDPEALNILTRIVKKFSV